MHTTGRQECLVVAMPAFREECHSDRQECMPTGRNALLPGGMYLLMHSRQQGIDR